MSGVTLSDLSKYHQGAMKWFKDGLVSEHNRLFAQTEEAGAVSFWPLGGTPLEGKVKFSFKETPPASGDKGPENPSTISGVNEIKFVKAGKNFFAPAPGASFSNVGNIQNLNGVSMTTLPDFAYSFTGTATQDALFYLRYNGKNAGIKVKNNKTYTFSGCPSGGSASTYFMAWHPAVGGNVYDFGNGVTVRNPKVTATLWSFNCQIYIKSGTTVSNLVFKPQVEFGDTVTEYEVPEVVEPVIDLGSTYYGGEIDLATGVMTVTHGVKVLDGTEAWNATAVQLAEGVYRYGYSETQNRIGSLGADGGAVCSHFNYVYNYNSPQVSFYIGPYDTGAYSNTFFCFKSSKPTTEQFTAWLNDQYVAGTPVTVAGLLKNPLTVQLTPLQLTALTQKDKYTPRINTVYTDADSIQIRYRKSLIHDEDEKVQAIVALGGNV